jgi:hypothetical protein
VRVSTEQTEKGVEARIGKLVQKINFGIGFELEGAASGFGASGAERVRFDESEISPLAGSAFVLGLVGLFAGVVVATGAALAIGWPGGLDSIIGGGAGVIGMTDGGGAIGLGWLEG